VNGLIDGNGLRVLGAASVDPSLLRGIDDEHARRIAAIAIQARNLPQDSRGIAPSIRYHGRRIAEANRRWDPPAAPAASPAPAAHDQEQEIADPLPRSLHFDQNPRSGADLPGQVRQLVDSARARLTTQAPPSIRLDARLAALTAIGQYADVLDTLSAAATAGGDIRALVDAVAELSRMVNEYGDQHALTDDPAWQDLHGTDPLDATEMNTRTAEIDPSTLRFHVLDQAIMAAQITRVMGQEFGDYVTERFAGMLPLNAESVRALVAPDQQHRLDKPLADPQTVALHDSGLDLMFMRPGRSLLAAASSMVHEATHGLQPSWVAEQIEIKAGARTKAESKDRIAQRKFEREFEAFSAQREFLRRLLHHRTHEQLQQRRRHRAVPDQYRDMVYGTDAALEEDVRSKYFVRDADGRIAPRDTFLGHEREAATATEDVMDTLERYLRDLRRILHFGYDEPDEAALDRATHDHQ